MKTVKFVITLIILTGFTSFSFSQESYLYQFMKSQPSVLSVEDGRHEPYIANEKQDDLDELNEDNLNIASYVLCVHSSMTSTR